MGEALVNTLSQVLADHISSKSWEEAVEICQALLLTLRGKVRQAKRELREKEKKEKAKAK